MINELNQYSAYKDSGEEWLGAIPQSWEVRRAKYLFREVDERSTTGKEELLSVSHLTGVTPRSQKTITMFLAKSNIGHKMCRPGDLVINTMWAWMGALGVSNHTGIVSPAYGVYRPIAASFLVPAFADLLLRTPLYSAEYQRRSTGVNSSRLRLYPEQFLRMPVILPSRDEQFAIVRFLNWTDRRLNSAIKAKRKVIALLNEQRQAITHRAVTLGVDASILLVPARVRWLDERPVNWEELRLKNVLVRPLSNGLFKRSDDFGTGVPLVNVSDVYSPDGLIHGQNLERVRASSGEIETFKVHSGDVFFVRSSLKLEGTGRCALADVVEPDTVFECHIVRARPDKRRINPRFLTLFLSSWIGVNNTVSRANTVTMSTLDQGAIASLPILVPPMVEQTAILKFVDVESAPIIDAVSRLEREIDLLREYRTRLIADLVNGKFDVRKAVSALPDILLEADNGSAAVSMDSEAIEELAEEGLAT